MPKKTKPPAHLKLVHSAPAADPNEPPADWATDLPEDERRRQWAHILKVKSVIEMLRPDSKK